MKEMTYQGKGLGKFEGEIIQVKCVKYESEDQINPTVNKGGTRWTTYDSVDDPWQRSPYLKFRTRGH